MTLFALMLSTRYEGEMILGVYSSADAATAASEAFVLAHRPEGELNGSESFEIRPVALDAAAQHHW
jgi:hypothetical protein